MRFRRIRINTGDGKKNFGAILRSQAIDAGLFRAMRAKKTLKKTIDGGIEYKRRN